MKGEGPLPYDSKEDRSIVVHPHLSLLSALIFGVAVESPTYY